MKFAYNLTLDCISSSEIETLYRYKSINHVIQEVEFQNLVKGVQVQNTARKALLDVNEKEWTIFIERLPDCEKHQLSTFLQCFEQYNSKTCSTKSYQLNCGHPNCSLLYTRLKNLNIKTNVAAELDEENLLPRMGKMSTYYDSSITWDFVKCFIILLDIKADVSLFKSKVGITLLIKLMKNCILFAFEDSDKIYDQILEDTDTLIYSQDLHISNEQLGKLSDNLQMLLKHWMKEFRSCEDAIKDINKLTRKTTDCESDEYKLLVQNVLKIVEGIQSMEEGETDHHGHEVNTSRELISSLLKQMNKTPFVMQEQEDGSESLQKNEMLKGEIQNIRTKLNNMETLIEENYCELTELKQENEALEQEKQAIQMENERLEILIKEKHCEVTKLREENESLKKEKLAIQVKNEQLILREEENIRLYEKFGERICMKIIKKFTKGEKIRLQEKVRKHLCRERLKFLNSIPWNIFDKRHFQLRWASLSKIQVTSNGSLQNVLVQVEEINVLFDPFDEHLHEVFFRRKFNGMMIDAVVLSSCMYSVTESIVKYIQEAYPSVIWIVPHGRKDKLIRLGVDCKSITEFELWDEQNVRIGRKYITFVCIPTYRKIASRRQLYQCETFGWIITGTLSNFFSSGITNYNEEIFEEIKEKYSPIDVALLPISSRCRVNMFRTVRFGRTIGNDSILHKSTSLLDRCVECPLLVRYVNMSCSPEFEVEIDEILEMHRKLQPCISLGIDNEWLYGEDQELLLKEKMEEMNLDCGQFYFLLPGEEYS